MTGTYSTPQCAGGFLFYSKTMPNTIETGYKLQKNFPHNIKVCYEQGNISAIVDGQVVLEYSDTQPLHEKNGLEYVGFNAWYHKQGSVNFSDFKITHE